MPDAAPHRGPTAEELDPELVAELRRRVAQNQRAKLVVDTILAKGFMNTAELSDAGYEHPPRAAQDVRELGIPLLSPLAPVDGRNIAHYRFPGRVALDRDATGRRKPPPSLKQELIDAHGPVDMFSGTELPVSMLEVDHRIPFAVLPDSDDSLNPDDFMLVSGSMNSTKSRECQRCPNWTQRDPATCETCYWAIPDRDYKHVATLPLRRPDIAWTGDAEVNDFETLLSRARAQGLTMSEFLKQQMARIAAE